MDVCVCCGNYTPEGSQMCWKCMRDIEHKDTSVTELAALLTLAVEVGL